MSVFTKLTRNDILFSTVHAKPRINAKYTSTGWQSNTGVSSSLSLYGGVRSRRDVRSEDILSSGISLYPLDELDTHSIDKVIYVSGSYPSTGSIQYVSCKNDPASIFSVTQNQWYEEHYRPIRLLYNYYNRIDPNYFIGNHDYYSTMLLASEANYSGSHFIFSGTFSGSASSLSTFTSEMWVKPLMIGTNESLPFPHSPVLLQNPARWHILLNQNGTVGFSSGLTATASSSISVNHSKWNHIAVVVSGGLSASFYVNGQFGGTKALTALPAQTSNVLAVGCHEQNSLSSRQSGNGVNGFLFETRIWKTARSLSEIQTASSGTISSSSLDLVHYGRFNDGPLNTDHGFSAGLGVLDHSVYAHHGTTVLENFLPKWQPNDHPTFIPLLKKINEDLNELRVIHVPSMFYGRQIDPGSVVIKDGVYNSREVVRVFNDDGRGTLYVSGSMTQEASDEQYTGNRRIKVGNVFYTEGLIVFTDPALYDMMNSGSAYWSSTPTATGSFRNLIEIDFKGQTRIHTKTFNCRIHQTQLNASNNPTFSYLDTNGTETRDDDRTLVIRNDGITYITAIGLYNEDRKLVGVAKLAQPVRKREKDKLNIRLKFDM